MFHNVPYIHNQIKGEIQWSGKFHSNDRYGPCEAWENFIFSFFAPWCSEFHFWIQLLTSFKYNPVHQQFKLCGNRLNSQWTPSGLFEYTPGLGALTEVTGCTWECKGCPWLKQFSHTSQGPYLTYEWNLPDHCISSLTVSVSLVVSVRFERVTNNHGLDKHFVYPYLSALTVFH